jgi:hypothetical protein
VIHENSLDAYRAEQPRLSARAMRVLEWIEAHGAATDRQVMHGLGFKDPNAVRPRITELVDAGRLLEVRNTKCPETGKTVRVVDVKRGPSQQELFQ